MDVGFLNGVVRLRVGVVFLSLFAGVVVFRFLLLKVFVIFGVGAGLWGVDPSFFGATLVGDF